MDWYYRLHELPRVKLDGILMSLLRWADLPCFYPLFVQARTLEEAEAEMDKRIADLVLYNAPTRGPFPCKEDALVEAKREFNKFMDEEKQSVFA